MIRWYQSKEEFRKECIFLHFPHIFSVDLHIDALIWGLYYCIRFAKSLVRLLERYILKGVCYCVDEGLTWGVRLAWEQRNRLVVGRNFVCYLAMVVIFMGLGQAKRWWGLQSSYGQMEGGWSRGQKVKGRGAIFMEE